MPSITPYLIRAYCHFFEDSDLTPNILVDCSRANVVVPKAYIQQGKIILNISANATKALLIGNDVLSFEARFDGKSCAISVPIIAVLSIHAGENGKGVFFDNQNLQQQEKSKPTLKLL